VRLMTAMLCSLRHQYLQHGGWQHLVRQLPDHRQRGRRLDPVHVQYGLFLRLRLYHHCPLLQCVGLGGEGVGGGDAANGHLLLRGTRVHRLQLVCRRQRVLWRLVHPYAACVTILALTAQTKATDFTIAPAQRARSTRTAQLPAAALARVRNTLAVHQGCIGANAVGLRAHSLQQLPGGLAVRLGPVPLYGPRVPVLL
jgi:hypothetical protein